MALSTRPLGRSGLNITRVGFGAWAAGGGGWAFGWGPQDDAASLAAMRHALERGVNWIDTAAVYGLGHSEEVVGQLLRELPPADRPFVFTKCGLVWNDQDRMAKPQRVLTPESIRQRVRGLAAPARRRAHRPLPVPLARRDAARRSRTRGRRWRGWSSREDPRGRRLELRRAPARAVRGRSATWTRCSRRSR